MLIQEILKCKARQSINHLRNQEHLLDYVLLAAEQRDQTCLENQEDIFMEVSSLLEGPTNLFIQGEKEKTTTVYGMEGKNLEKNTVRRSMLRWRCLWDRIRLMCRRTSSWR